LIKAIRIMVIIKTVEINEGNEREIPWGGSVRVHEK